MRYKKSRPLGDFHNMFDWYQKIFKYPVIALHLLLDCNSPSALFQFLIFNQKWYQIISEYLEDPNHILSWCRLNVGRKQQ